LSLAAFYGKQLFVSKISRSFEVSPSNQHNIYRLFPRRRSRGFDVFSKIEESDIPGTGVELSWQLTRRIAEKRLRTLIHESEQSGP
jgi:hypothetical protein